MLAFAYYEVILVGYGQPVVARLTICTYNVQVDNGSVCNGCSRCWLWSAKGLMVGPVCVNDVWQLRVLGLPCQLLEQKTPSISVCVHNQYMFYSSCGIVYANSQINLQENC